MHLYERIYLDLRRLVEEGEVRPGERLPSIREAARKYGCNKLTAQKAYDLLSAAGLAENRVGSGSFALPPGSGQAREGELAVSVLSEEFFPYGPAGDLLAEALKSERGRVFSAPPVRGVPGLRESLAGLYRLPEESLLVLSGAQQGLELCRRLFGDRARPVVLAEEPTYPAALALFRPSGHLPLGSEGPNPEEFDRFWMSAGPGPRVFYTVPDLHNPTGLRYSRERKRALADLARRRDVWILEDDYLSETDPSSTPRFADLVPERTIWIKSLSKTTAPGIRVGLLSAPDSVLTRLENLKSESDPGPATWLQLFLDRFYRSGLYARHLAACASAASARRAELDALLSRFPGLSRDPASAGWNLWVTADREAAPASPPWAEGRHFGSNPATRRSFRISFMSPGPSAWAGALGRLESALASAYPKV
ncbi:MAG TPA: PLP-dependent aminotransferase family protein [Spirochaetia bacterium]|nr:PLP-dependent aminotransferase family protein [Spirochaetales bacterium]HRY78793.1 PLP-dependent aminotransferase family protein [Spirochaetia bacterium]HRZ88358.1 PLP-dependent aminotransferase family protein [Spirochaetia bacterium]